MSSFLGSTHNLEHQLKEIECNPELRIRMDDFFTEKEY